MKWIFSLLLAALVYTNQARDFIIITYDQNLSFKNEVKKIILEELQVPKKYLTWKKTPNPCQTYGNPLLQICLKNRQLKVIKSQSDVIKRTLRRIILPVENQEFIDKAEVNPLPKKAKSFQENL